MSNRLEKLHPNQLDLFTNNDSDVKKNEEPDTPSVNCKENISDCSPGNSNTAKIISFSSFTADRSKIYDSILKRTMS